MIPGSFTYHRPKSLADAVGLLADLGEDARALAGGHSLIPMMKLRLASPEHLVDLADIGDLKGIRPDGDDILIGAMTTQQELIASDLLAAKLPILREASLLCRSSSEALTPTTITTTTDAWRCSTPNGVRPTSTSVAQVTTTAGKILPS